MYPPFGSSPSFPIESVLKEESAEVSVDFSFASVAEGSNRVGEVVP